MRNLGTVLACSLAICMIAVFTPSAKAADATGVFATVIDIPCGTFLDNMHSQSPDIYKLGYTYYIAGWLTSANAFLPKTYSINDRQSHKEVHLD